MTNDTPAIEFESVTQTFGHITALSDLSLEVHPGERYGFLGPNGAGKTTAIGLLLNFLRPTDGTVRVFGRNVQSNELAVKSRTGALPQGFTPYSNLTGYEHLEFACSVRGVDTDPEDVLERVGLLDAAEQKANGYSQGMVRRLGFAMALVGEPDLLILDEPIAGLDPSGAARIRELIREQNERGATVFVSSHQLAQVETICDRVGIISEGTMVAEASVSELQARIDGGPRLVITLADGPVSVPDAVMAVEGVEDAWVDESRVIVSCESASVRTDVLVALEEAGIDVIDFETERASLEDVFAAYADTENV
ncbi:ABC transporter ATP-binding protein [Natronobacterium texcoconense]|uniref:ABC-2 type transport system ATP-binding protein n=1 Tax=Natronobacterium texcoconense TaxID=1095778 RepID=A0A1H0Z6X6_NATTX|nr:ABC transporter ATP-binding protein [Natronobacterium texcoconense]SDQ23227.1 ABC-2 type transport system ATP-binding protein [Natronobacterium texcoconense]